MHVYAWSGAAHQLSSIFLLQLWKKIKAECNKLAHVELAQFPRVTLAFQLLTGRGKKGKHLSDFLLCEGHSLKEWVSLPSWESCPIENADRIAMQETQQEERLPVPLFWAAEHSPGMWRFLVSNRYALSYINVIQPCLQGSNKKSKGGKKRHLFTLLL